MIKRKFDPILEQKVEYIYYSHPKPWRLSVGDILSEEIENGTIKVNFTLSRLDAISEGRWDPVKECVILEVLDKDNRVVFETAVPVKKSFIEGRIGLR